MSENFAADVARVAALGEPVRRELYCYVVAQDEPVSREAAAAATGVAHHVAKFNLDRLVAEGLLDVEYSRPPGRSGPGAGRPAKLYRRSDRDVSVSLPARRYDLAGRVLAEAVTVATRDGVPVDQALRTAARTTGRTLLKNHPAEAQRDGDEDVVTAVLARNGYEPRTIDGEVFLANCPFHSLAAQYTELVCGMNLDLIDGLLAADGARGRCARLNPGPDQCCVTITHDQR
ncbi:helix-turn-helix transcriptional regulator [Micromonospora sp. GCM10011542]|uniref:helix-turn-helix transcriptional regulator n=1 Tax=Micromonospora sp. GCM10011542 TaxID=3317337 RepID=UPI0036130784